MTEEQFARYDSADYLKTEEDIAAYLEAVMEEGGDDPAYLARALGTVARARNMSALAREVATMRAWPTAAGSTMSAVNWRAIPGSCTNTALPITT